MVCLSGAGQSGRGKIICTSSIEVYLDKQVTIWVFTLTSKSLSGFLHCQTIKSLSISVFFIVKQCKEPILCI